ncbi:hypothetical protein V6260_00495 [Pseudoalteromonas aliena]|uniref:hypothetical protein n=1 Tax=Pseudoalteromonas aliena TaxID=247523 RepID=UPI00311EE663
MNEFDEFIKAVIERAIDDNTTCSELLAESDKVYFKLKVTPKDGVGNVRELNVVYSSNSSHDNLIKHKEELNVYLKKGTESSSFISQTVLKLNSEIDSFIKSQEFRHTIYI